MSCDVQLAKGQSIETPSGDVVTLQHVRNVSQGGGKPSPVAVLSIGGKPKTKARAKTKRESN